MVTFRNPLAPYKRKDTYIKNMWLQPCQINPIVWVFGHIVASPAFLFALHTPDCLDYAYDRARVGHRKNRKGRITPLPEIANPLTPPSKGWGYAAFMLGNFAQKIGFWMTMIDATQEWLIYGASFAYQLSGCRDPNTAYRIIFFNDTPMYLGFLPGEHMVDVWTFGSGHIFESSSIGIQCPVGFSATCGYTITQKPFPVNGSQPSYSAYIYDSMTGTRGPVVPGTMNPDGTRSATAFWPGPVDVALAHSFNLIINQHEPGIMYGSAMMSASGDNFTDLAKSYCGQSPIKDN